MLEPRTGDPANPDDPSDGELDSESWLVGLRRPTVELRLDVRVQRFVTFFTQSNQGRGIFRRWLARSGRYRDDVASALRERALPPDLAAVVFIESGWSPTAVSRAGAVGLWQFMPHTGRVYGLSIDEDYDERRSVLRSSEAAARLLSDLHGAFGSWEMALAAYDMGYAALLTRIRKYNTNDYWQLSRIDDALPREVLLYVPKVAAAALVLANLDRYSLDDTRIDAALEVSDLEIPPGTELSLVARASGTSVRRIRLLNPELLTDRVPDRGDDLSLHVPSSGLARARVMLPGLLSDRRDGRPDTGVDLDFDWGRDDIAPKKAHRKEADAFATVAAAALIDVGRRPVRIESASSEPAEAGGPADPAMRDAARARPRDRAVAEYHIQRGDTLNGIARAFGVEVRDIVRRNAIDPNATLHRGMVLRLDVANDPEAPARARDLAAKERAKDAEDAPKANPMVKESRPAAPRATPAVAERTRADHDADHGDGVAEPPRRLPEEVQSSFVPEPPHMDSPNRPRDTASVTSAHPNRTALTREDGPKNDFEVSSRLPVTRVRLPVTIDARRRSDTALPHRVAPAPPVPMNLDDTSSASSLAPRKTL